MNVKSKQQEQKQQSTETGKGGSSSKPQGDQKGSAENSQDNGDQESKGYTAEQLQSMQRLQQEAENVRYLKGNDGEGTSPAISEDFPTKIDEADQFTPDNWVPRTRHLIRLTGKHPLNGEADLTELYEAGLITPNRLHFVRNHGAVPHLLWETHKLEVTAGRSLTLLMDELMDQFRSINIPIFLACDGNRRKELNMIKRSKGFNYGPAAVGCAYWKGVLLRDVLLAADVSDIVDNRPYTRLWVNFEGSDQLSEGKYATSIPLEHAMDPNNDVMLAYEMNNTPLPPDHGYPLRVMIPGYIGGRCVKWLAKIWISDRENDSYYHIYDNRVLPSFVADQNSEIAKIMFNHPSTSCNEQNLNSVIVKPAQGETIDLREIKRGRSYIIEGFAYNGGGNEVQRVEVSLDGGQDWLYCTRVVRTSPGKRSPQLRFLSPYFYVFTRVFCAVT